MLNQTRYVGDSIIPGIFVSTKEELEEILRISLEMRRRVKEQLKKLGGMEFYDVNFSYIDIEESKWSY